MGTGGIRGDGGIIKNCEVVVGEDDGKNLSRTSEQQSMEGSVEDGSSTPSPSAEGGIPYSSVVTWLVKKILNLMLVGRGERGKIRARSPLAMMYGVQKEARV